LLLLKNEVIAFAGEICASKSANGTNPKIRSGSVLMATMLFLMERILFEVASGRMAGWQTAKCSLRNDCQKPSAGPTKTTCGKASLARAVMLHLRVCYVSKAAILTIPALHVPVENRSPA
jgi:hypothetical protein